MQGADGEDSSGEEGDDEPFEVLARKMDNITPDGGVKKMVLKQGTGGPVSFRVCVGNFPEFSRSIINCIFFLHID